MTVTVKDDIYFIVEQAIDYAFEKKKFLDEYIKGGKDNDHKQLREAYGHLPKPDARKIRNYLNTILEDASRYEKDKRRGRRKVTNK